MNTRSTVTALGLIFGLGLTAGFGSAAPAAEPVRGSEAFNRIDEDDDGVIDADEVRASSETWFLAYDTDGDGYVSADEIAGRGGERGSARMVLGDLDADGDGSVSRDEFVGAQRGYYDEIAPSETITTRDYGAAVSERDNPLVPDLDEDDFVSEDEAAADWERTFLVMDRDRGDALSEDEWLGDVDGGPTYEDLDTDADNSVSRREYLAYGQQGYDATRDRLGADQLTTRDYTLSTRWRDEALTPSADLDGDGIISAAEAEADAGRWFDRADRDSNTFLDPPEYYGDISVQDMLGIGQGEVIAQEDIITYREQELGDADLDGDGVVTVWEYRSYRRN